MTVFHAFAWLCIVGGFSFGLWHALDQDAWGAMLGALRGAGLGFALYFGSMFVLFAVFSLGLRYRPFFPRCRAGRCLDGQYTYLYLDEAPTGRHKELQDSLDGKLVRCKCGTLYLDSLRERRFYEVRDDGSLAPYMGYSPLGRWRPDPRAQR
jgi:hypothetical protein